MTTLLARSADEDEIEAIGRDLQHAIAVPL